LTYSPLFLWAYPPFHRQFLGFGRPAILAAIFAGFGGNSCIKYMLRALLISSAAAIVFINGRIDGENPY
jgi:hypothetical protein|tara:strand:- start:2598 stop:2804 length:207 start_codon:yes stop_codon:yes gene_type:complete